MTVAQLIEELKKLPQDKLVFTQVVDQEIGAWNMFSEFHDVPNTQFVQLRVFHPELTELPGFPPILDHSEHGRRENIAPGDYGACCCEGTDQEAYCSEAGCMFCRASLYKDLYG